MANIPNESCFTVVVYFDIMDLFQFTQRPNTIMCVRKLEAHLKPSSNADISLMSHIPLYLNIWDWA